MISVASAQWVNAVPADSPPSWMVYSLVRSPHRCLLGTSLSNHCTDQCSVNRTATDPQMGAKPNLCPLHFALLSCIVWREQSHCAAMWTHNDGSTESWWLSITLGSSDWRRCQLVIPKLSSITCMAVVTLASYHRVASFFFSNYTTKIQHGMSVMMCRALFFVVVRQRDSTTVGVAGRINIVGKKAASVGWLNIVSLEAGRRRRMTTEFKSTQDNTSPE